MSATVPARTSLPQALRNLDWRVLVVVAAAVAVVLESPAWLRGPLSAVAAIAALTYCLPRTRRRESIDTALNAVGGVAVVLVVLGLVLNLLPTGLTAVAWGIGVGVIELAIMVMFAFRPRSRGGRGFAGLLDATARRRALAVVGWGALIGGVLTGALVFSVQSYERTHVPPVDLGAEASRGGVEISVSSGKAAGPFDLRLVDDAGAVTVLKSDVTVGPGDAEVTVRVPATTAGRVELVRAGESRAVRSLVLDGAIEKTGDG